MIYAIFDMLKMIFLGWLILVALYYYKSYKILLRHTTDLERKLLDTEQLYFDAIHEKQKLEKQLKNTS